MSSTRPLTRIGKELRTLQSLDSCRLLHQSSEPQGWLGPCSIQLAMTVICVISTMYARGRQPATWPEVWE